MADFHNLKRKLESMTSRTDDGQRISVVFFFIEHHRLGKKNWWKQILKIKCQNIFSQVLWQFSSLTIR